MTSKGGSLNAFGMNLFCSAMHFFQGFLAVIDNRYLGAGFAQNQGSIIADYPSRPRPEGCGRTIAATRAERRLAWETADSSCMSADLQHLHAFQRSGADGEDKSASLALFAGESDIAAQHAGQPFAQGQPKPHAHILAACSGVALGERFEKSLDLILGHADAGVDDFAFQQGIFLIVFNELHLDANMPFLGELYGIADQVDQDLPHSDRIGANGLRNQSGEFHEQGQTLGVGADFHHRNHVFDQLAAASTSPVPSRNVPFRSWKDREYR